MKKLLLLFIAFIPLTVYSQKDSAAIRFSQTITSDDLDKHLKILASDEYEGRETGKKGQKMAAEYISDQFRIFGIPSLKNGTYYQEFDLVEERMATVKFSIGNNSYVSLKDYYYYPGQPEITINTSSILFLGHGISDDKYNDYKGNNVKDKVVLILHSEPHSADSVYLITGQKKASSWTFNFRKKTELAREKGAKAVLITVPDHLVPVMIKNGKKFMEHSSANLPGEKVQTGKRIPVIYISETMANEIVRGQKRTIEEIRNKIASSGKPVTFSAKAEVKVEVDQNIENITGENVLGYIEGSDLKHELVVITAHYDHLGIVDGKIYNGADDDGSGTVAIMEIAEAFAKAKAQGKGPRRSVLIMAVSGEEKGLLGSEYYVRNPVFPLENTVANLNIDMIGRQDEKYKDNADYIYLIGADRLSTDLHKINEEANKQYVNIELDYTYNDPKDKNRYYYRSDHYNFAKNNIPVIFYFNGVHEDYHEHTDEVDKINFEKMEKITRLVFHTAWELVNRDDRIKVDKK